MEKNIKIFTLSSNKPLAQEIAHNMGLELGACEVKRFADGEVNVQIDETVRGADVFVVQSTCTPVNDNLFELLIMCDALKRASAKTINLVIPYYGYSRQDKKAKSRQPITAKLIANMLEKAGANRVVYMDIHATQIQGFFNIPVDNLISLPILGGYFAEKNLENIVIVSPDHNGTTRARDYGKILNAPIAIIDKRYSEMRNTDVMHIIGDVKGKTCIIVDDMCETADTLVHAVDALIENGAVDVYAACTHGVFSGNAIAKINASKINKLVITNTIYHDKDSLGKKIEVLSVGKIMGHALSRIINNEPLSNIFTYSFDPSKKDQL